MAEGACSEPEAPRVQPAEMNEEFQFLLCDRCHAEVPHPRLLPCLHNLCSQCLEETKPIEHCVICGTPYSAVNPENLDNVFFANLQVKFNLYQKVIGSKGLACDNCKEKAEFWCSTCEEFLCLTCFRTHQRYLKKESHEARPLTDFQAESCRDFLATIRKSSPMFCSKMGHDTQILSIYCRQCSQSMCPVCALLDREHMHQHCDITQEIKCRQDELENMSMELEEKKDTYDRNYSSLEELVRNMEQLRNETRELIQQKIEEMIQMLLEKGEGFVAEVEAHHNHQVQEVKRKLQEMDGVVRRITSSQRMVERLHLYASGQEVLEMHPFLRRSMAELGRKQPSTAEGIEASNFLETKSQLQNLLERMTKGKETVAAESQTEPQEEVAPSTDIPRTPHISTDFPGRSSLKRQYTEREMNTERHPKMVKVEPLSEEEQNESAFIMNEPGTSYGSAGGCYTTGSHRGLRETPDDTLLIANDYSCSSDLDDDSSMDISSEEESTDDLDETGASVFPLDINPTSPVVQENPTKNPLSKPVDVSSESRIIYFDLKSISGNILHLAALGVDGTIFHVNVSCLEFIGEKVCVPGMDEFLQHLSSLQRPILVGYKLWSMDIPNLLDALQLINKEEQFEASISGFLDALPLIRDEFPAISNGTLRHLEKIYQQGQVDEAGVGVCAKALKELCTSFEINNVFQTRPPTACSSFKCYFSLQPLRQQKVLSTPSAQTLALHNISLSKLLAVYESDREKGLKKLCRSLNTKLKIGEKKIQRLSKIRTYLESLLSLVGIQKISPLVH